MKKLYILLIICITITGCSSINSTKTVSTISEVPTPIIKQTELTLKAEPTIIPTKIPTVIENQPDDKFDNSEQQNVITTTSDKNQSRFIGAIGRTQVHASLNIEEDIVSGVYYYDKYKININLSGTLNNIRKDYRCIDLCEDTKQEGRIYGILKSEDYIQGYWKNEDKVYPMYLIREGSDIAPPKTPEMNTMLFDGEWSGINSSYFDGSRLYIKALFEDLIYYDLFAFNGTNMGEVDSLAIVQNKTATSEIDPIFDGEDNAIFDFLIKDNNIYLTAENYDGWCGMGVYFDDVYTKGKVKIPFPTAQDVGIVENKEQDELFLKVVGEDYSLFIQNTQYAMLEEMSFNEKTVKAGKSYLRGYSGICYYIISPDYIYTARIGDESIIYYTNDPEYADELPSLIAEWANDDLPVVYKYIE